MEEEMKVGDFYTEWELIQDGMCVAASNDRDEIARYAWQYLEDGDVEIWEVKKTCTDTLKKSRKNEHSN